MMSQPSKRFEDFPTVDCNECSRYWDNSCDGVKPSSEAQKRVCNSFVATRSVIIPEQIKTLQKCIKILSWSVILTNIHLLIIVACIIWR